MDSIKSNHRHVPGFTLVELLVVISIIALLVSILMPALSKARFQAKLVVCGTQQKQVVLGLQTYAAEYDGDLPPNIGMNVNGSHAWWDFSHRISTVNPNQVIEFMGPLFENVLPTVDIWFCPLSTLSPDTPLVNGAVTSTYQEVYANPDPVNFPYVWMTYTTFWRFGGCAYEPLTNNSLNGEPRSFRGPGLKNWDSLRPGPNSDLAIMDFLGYGMNSTQYVSGHPFEGSSKGSIFHVGPTGAVKNDLVAEIGNVQYNAGYMDGHVERFDTAGTTPEGQDMSRGLFYYLPDGWQHVDYKYK